VASDLAFVVAAFEGFDQTPSRDVVHRARLVGAIDHRQDPVYQSLIVVQHMIANHIINRVPRLQPIISLPRFREIQNQGKGRTLKRNIQLVILQNIFPGPFPIFQIKLRDQTRTIRQVLKSLRLPAVFEIHIHVQIELIILAKLAEF
jgi:hypothetical protein